MQLHPQNPLDYGTAPARFAGWIALLVGVGGPPLIVLPTILLESFLPMLILSIFAFTFICLTRDRWRSSKLGRAGMFLTLYWSAVLAVCSTIAIIMLRNE